MAADPQLLSLAALITSAHIANNPVSMDELPDLIRSVYKSLSGAGAPVATGPEPAVPIKKSVFPDYIVCLEDGKKLKLLKRHLQVSYGMTPDEYRARWGLPPDYPMASPNYAANRSRLAKAAGLGRKESLASAPRVFRVPEGVSGKQAARRKVAD